jgi:hypothetical protein
LQHGGGASLDAHLVFNADAVHIVARTRDGRLSFSLFAALERRHLQALNLHASAAVSSTQAGMLVCLNPSMRGVPVAVQMPRTVSRKKKLRQC